MKNKFLLLSILAVLNISYNIAFSAEITLKTEQEIKKFDYPTAIIHLKNQLQAEPNNPQFRFLLGSVYLKAGKIEDSAKELGRAHKLAPNDVKILFRYIDVLQLSAKHRKIIKLLDTALPDKKQESLRLSYLGTAHLNLKHFSDASALFEQANHFYKNATAYNGMATIAIIENDHVLARKLLDKSLTINPGNTETLHIIAKLENINKKSEKALKIYNQLVKDNPKNLSYRLERAATLMILKKNKLAMNDLDIILKKIKLQPQANFIKAQILLQEKDYKGAQEAAQNVINILPKHMPAAFILGAANFALKNYNQAEEYLTIYIANYPENIKAQNLLANLYLAKKEPQQSLLILEGIPKQLLESNPLLMMTLASTYIQMGDAQKGIKILGKALSIAPDNNEIRIRLIAAQFKAGELNSAITGLEQLTTSSSDYSKKTEANYLLMVSLIKQKQYTKAEKLIEQSLKISPNDFKLLNLQALAEQLDGNLDKAIIRYQAIIKKDKTNIPALMGLARIYVVQANWEKAKQYFNQVLEINPNELKAYLGLAAIAEKQGKSEAAEQYFWDALKQTQNNISETLILADLLTRWYRGKKQPEKTLDLANTLVKQNPDSIALRSFLAKAQILNKQYKAAERTLTKLIRLNRNDVKHRILLAQLMMKDGKRTDEALILINKALTINNYTLSIYTLKVKVLVSQKDYEQAINLAQSIQLKFPKVNTGKLLEAEINRIQKKFNKSIALYQEAYTIQPDRKIFATIINILVSRQEVDKAIVLLTEKVNNSPDDINNLFILASLLQESKQLKQSEVYYQKILSQDAKHIFSLNNLAWIKMNSDLKQAIKLAKAAYELSPETTSIVDSYGYFLVLDGNYVKGIQLLEKAALAKPEDNDIQYHLALGYSKTGGEHKAQNILQKIVNSSNNFQEKDKAQTLYNSIK